MIRSVSHPLEVKDEASDDHLNDIPVKRMKSLYATNIIYRRLIMIPLITIACFSLAAQAGDEVPHKISAALTLYDDPEDTEAFEVFNLDDLPLTEPDATPQWGEDEGHATHFGAFTTIYRFDFLNEVRFEDGVPYIPVHGYFILTAADGSQFYGVNFTKFYGFGLTNEFTADFLEGTGRFEGLTASVSGISVPGGYIAEGTMTNPGRGRRGSRP